MWLLRSSLSDSWFQHLKAWMRSIFAVRTWGHTHTHTPLLISTCDILSFSMPLSSVYHLSSDHSHTCLSCSFFYVMSLKFTLQEQQYAQWMAGCRLASKGKTLADSSFQSEIQSIRSFLAMQKTNSSSSSANASEESINTHSLVSPRYHKKYKPKQVQM